MTMNMLHTTVLKAVLVTPTFSWVLFNSPSFIGYLKFEVLIVITALMVAFWVLKPHNLVSGCRCVGGTYHPLLYG
jgi:hypothetical protein